MTQMSAFRRPRWRDPRLGIGVLLVAVSVALGAWIFAQADKTQAIYRAGAPIAVGEGAGTAALELINVNLGAASERYAAPEGADPLNLDDGDVVFIRAVPAGELVPRSSLGSAADLHLRPLSVPVANSAPVEVGSIVDLWVSPVDVTGAESGEPELVATGLHVSGIEEDESLFAGAGEQLVRVLVEESSIGRVLGVLGSRSTVTLVPQLGG